MNIQLLFFSNDHYFAELFSNYVGSAQHEFTIACFTDREKALAYWQEHKTAIQAVLAPQDFLALCSGLPLAVAMVDFTRCTPSAEEVQYLNIYQQRRDILSDLQLILSTHLGLNKTRRSHGHTKVLSFFSTQGGAGKTSLAYLTAVRAAQKGKTVFLSLEPAPLPETLYAPFQGPVSGEDLIYAVKDHQAAEKGILPALSHNADNVYVLPTPKSLCDLMELTTDDWQFLVEGILQNVGADHLILDLGSGLSSLARMAFDHSDTAVLVYTDDAVGQGKRDRFLNDPNFNQLGISCPFIEARNQCHRKLEATKDVVPFPFSKTLAGGELPAVALSGNSELYNGCTLLLDAVNREV